MKNIKNYKYNIVNNIINYRILLVKQFKLNNNKYMKMIDINKILNYYNYYNYNYNINNKKSKIYNNNYKILIFNYFKNNRNKLNQNNQMLTQKISIINNKIS